MGRLGTSWSSSAEGGGQNTHELVVHDIAGGRTGRCAAVPGREVVVVVREDLVEEEHQE